MTLNHIHLRVRDLNVAAVWFEKVLQVHPGFRNAQMATFSLASLTLILDKASDDVSATVGFESDDCDGDFRRVVERVQSRLSPRPTRLGESELRISKVRVN
jgi:hypothetical protein